MKRFKKITKAQWGIITLILALVVAKLLHGFLLYQELHQTSALFIGLPALIAIILTLRPKAKNIIGMITRGITIALLASIIVLHEGVICIVMVAPLFYLVGIIVGMVMDRRRAPGHHHKFMSGVLLLPLLLMSLEGTHEILSFSRYEEVIVSRVVEASPAAVEEALSQVPQFNDEQLPIFLRLGFPTPLTTSGSGLQVGDQRMIGFTAGTDAPTGALRFEVTAREENGFVMTALSDSSKIAEWLRWHEAEVHWEKVAEGQTLVTWQLRYDRLLDPAWYFAPAERYAVELAADYLIKMLATP